MEKAFGYLRVSGVSQVKGDGFTRQEKAIKDYAKANNLQIEDVFKEQGISGTKENRPALAKLMLSLEQNGHGIETIVIEKLDRLARDLMIQEAIVADFKKRGFNIISTMEGPDLCGDDPTRKLIRQVMGAVAEYDKTMLVAKLQASRERERIKHGKCEGRKGYRESEEGKAIVRKIIALRRKTKDGRRRTWQQIADILNEEGVSTMDGQPWTLFRVNQLAYPYKKKRSWK
jgi:DNA invertase Pin-like site-specific DNA recombinase